MAMKGHKPAGGLHSRVVKHSTNPKAEPRAYARNPAAVSQLGNKVGNHVTSTVNTDYRGDPDFVRRGYNVVGPTNLAVSGPGAGREVMKAGGQGTHGAVNPGNPPAQRGDILSQYGPESKRS
jgi:hypothetical protein